MANSDWARHAFGVGSVIVGDWLVTPMPGWKMAIKTITDEEFYGCGWYENDGTLIEEVRRSKDDSVVAKSVNRVVEFDLREK